MYPISKYGIVLIKLICDKYILLRLQPVKIGGWNLLLRLRSSNEQY